MPSSSVLVAPGTAWGQQAVARPARVEPSVAREGGDEGPAHSALDDRSGDERPVVRDVAVAAVS
jgi:hypothetical protein